MSERARWNNGPRANDNRLNNAAKPSLFHCNRSNLLSEDIGLAPSWTSESVEDRLRRVVQKEMTSPSRNAMSVRMIIASSMIDKYTLG